MKEIRVKLKSPNNSYTVAIGNNLIKNLSKDLRRESVASKYIIITDSHVKSLYGEDLLNYFRNDGLGYVFLSFKQGEINKNLKTIRYLYDALLKRQIGRDSAIISLGGGVVGDIAGFVAATLYRGIPYIQVPTTLLAQVDSSIGGKVGVNHPSGKNFIGAFWQPQAVYIDVETLKTLPQKEILNGLAEAIKHAVIGGAEFFNFVVKNLKRILNLDSSIMEELIWRNCRLKSAVVAKDEKENGLRKILNFGHTIGHALEAVTAYRLNHGQAVAIGMAVETKLAEKIGMIKSEEARSITRLIKGAGLPSNIPTGLSVQKIIAATKADKKTVGGVPEYALPAGIGKMKYGIRVKEEIIKSVLEKIK